MWLGYNEPFLGRPLPLLLITRHTSIWQQAENKTTLWPFLTRNANRADDVPEES
jgi:hypothetical protein